MANNESDSAWPPTDPLNHLHRRAWDTFCRDLPALLETELGMWVAYHGSTKVATETTKKDLYELLITRSEHPSEFLVRQVQPLAPQQNLRLLGTLLGTELPATTSSVDVHATSQKPGAEGTNDSEREEIWRRLSNELGMDYGLTDAGWTTIEGGAGHGGRLVAAVHRCELGEGPSHRTEVVNLSGQAQVARLEVNAENAVLKLWYPRSKKTTSRPLVVLCPTSPTSRNDVLAQSPPRTALSLNAAFDVVTFEKLEPVTYWVVVLTPPDAPTGA